MIHLEEIAEFLNRFFAVQCYEEETGIYLPSSRPIKRLGLALQPWTELPQWVNSKNLDALFLHRPWKLEEKQLPPDIGVISYHLPFDERLTLSFNLRLAQIIGISETEVLGKKENRAIGMIGNIPTQSFNNLCGCVKQIFAGYEQVHATDSIVKRIAVVGAMTDSLVREAADRGADVYITGQLRQPAFEAMTETQIGAIAIGHHRSEIWGLRALAGVMRERWSNLEVVLPTVNRL